MRISWRLVGIAIAAAVVVGACQSENLTDQGSVHTVAMDATAGCSPGREGCPCSPAGTTTDCGQLVQDYGSYVTCSEGTSTCVQGTWGACQGNTLVTKSLGGATLGAGAGIRVLSVTSSCADPCDIINNCKQITDLPSDVPDAAGVLALEAGVTILPANCAGLQCQVDPTCGSSPTTLTGKVYDPAGNNPLFDAYVYIPIDPNPADLPAFSAGASCDSCAEESALNALAFAQTDALGNFTLTNVPTTVIAPKSPIPLVVQLGKWRRVTMLNVVPPCQTTPVPAASSRLPRNQTDGYNNHADMPQVAFVSGSADPFECMLLKAGIDPAEFGSSVTNSTRRFHYYNSPDSAGKSIDPAFGTVVNGDALWNSTNPAWKLPAYDEVILACEGAEFNDADRSNNGYANLVSYAGAGGRVFLTHFSYVWMKYNAPWEAIPSSWEPGTSTIDTQDPLDSTVVTTFPKGASFMSWLSGVNALDTSSDLEIHQGRQDTTPPLAAGVQPWLNATDTTSGGSNYTPAFTFETPLGAPATSQCGRAAFTDFHVATSAQVAPGGTCHQNTDCGFGSACSGTGVGTCADPPCFSAGDCGDPAWSCLGTAPGTCRRASCTGPTTCATGECVTVGGNSVCGCNVDADCGVNGTCDPTTNACTVGSCVSPSDCYTGEEGQDATCMGATAGTCAPNACTTSAQCAATSSGQEQCNGANCGGCRSSQDCPGGSVCGGLALGTCTGNPNNFPYECSQGLLDPQEAALEFLFFDLSACVGPVVPPEVITYNPVSFSVDFQSSCAVPLPDAAPPAVGTSVRWRELDWQASIPATASIAFAAQTAPAAADGGTPDYTGVQSVPLVTATTTTPNLPTQWNSTLIDVSGLDGGGLGAFNTASPPVASAADLRLTITLNPTTDQSQAPTLIQWRVKADCPASE